jgi:hypothetical protein
MSPDSGAVPFIIGASRELSLGSNHLSERPVCGFQSLKHFASNAHSWFFHCGSPASLVRPVQHGPGRMNRSKPYVMAIGEFDQSAHQFLHVF